MTGSSVSHPIASVASDAREASPSREPTRSESRLQARGARLPCTRRMTSLRDSSILTVMIRDAVHVPPVRDGSYPVRDGNDVRPLVDGALAFDHICAAVAAARRSVWVTIAFHERGFRMPGDHGSFFDVLDRARGRGLDVRVIFWRAPELEAKEPGTHFAGTEEQRRWLADRGARFLARWDRLPTPLCHHQKSWIVDAGDAGEVAFVGGINLDDASVSVPGHPHRDAGNIHDVYLELRGPAATDVHHNFVQRWNEASERRLADGAWPDPDAAGDLPFPAVASPPAGPVPVQITRTVRPGCYTDGTATPGGAAFAIDKGERSILAQYVAAIDAAQRTIYIEDQLFASPTILGRLYAALDRGVEVVFLVPGKAHPEFVQARRSGAHAAGFAFFDRLRERERFTLAGIASNHAAGQYHDVYVHAKIMLVDDAWATIGSANVVERSFREDTELNASLWHGETVRALRCALFDEHLGQDTRGLDDRAALRLYREIAVANRDCRARGEPLSGLAFAIDPAEYGYR
jgi:cardiolipin synthase